jgi:hypothetical protein
MTILLVLVLFISPYVSSGSPANAPATLENTMSKYQKLSAHLAELDGAEWPARFEEIEAILGFALPKSAYSYPAWWSNQADRGHSQSAAWQSIGWRTGEVNLAEQRVTFSREKPNLAEQQSVSAGMRANRGAGLTIAEAKAGLAVAFGVPQENIEITIRG